MAKQGMNPYRGRQIPKGAVQAAISKTLSMRAAAKELNVAYNTFKKYAKLYDLWETNQAGVGIKKGWAMQGVQAAGLLAGKHPNYPHYRLQEKLMREGYLAQECNNCGFDDYRRSDMTSPLIIDFMDGDGTNHKIDNLRLLCFNCFYILKDAARTITTPKNVTRLRTKLTEVFTNSADLS